MRAQLERVESGVGKTHVPLEYAESHYHLRTHIQFVRRIVETRNDEKRPAEGTPTPPSV